MFVRYTKMCSNSVNQYTTRWGCIGIGEIERLRDWKNCRDIKEIRADREIQEELWKNERY